MLTYNYDPLTTEYTGSEELRESPLEPGAWLVPAHSVAIEPPAALDGRAVCWTGQGWVHVEDHRGKTVWTPDGLCGTWEALGPIPDGLSLVQPPPAAAQVNAELDAQILALEARQARPLREMALGDVTALVRLQELDAQIEALRSRRLTEWTSALTSPGWVG